jgi:hypothetical protein
MRGFLFLAYRAYLDGTRAAQKEIQLLNEFSGWQHGQLEELKGHDCEK